MNDSQKEAIATADAHTSNVGLPTYSELVEALRKLHSEGQMYMARHRLDRSAMADAAALLARTPN